MKKTSQKEELELVSRKQPSNNIYRIDLDLSNKFQKMATARDEKAINLINRALQEWLDGYSTVNKIPYHQADVFE